MVIFHSYVSLPEGKLLNFWSFSTIIPQVHHGRLAMARSYGSAGSSSWSSLQVGMARKRNPAGVVIFMGNMMNNYEMVYRVTGVSYFQTSSGGIQTDDIHKSLKKSWKISKTENKHSSSFTSFTWSQAHVTPCQALKVLWSPRSTTTKTPKMLVNCSWEMMQTRRARWALAQTWEMEKFKFEVRYVGKRTENR